MKTETVNNAQLLAAQEVIEAQNTLIEQQRNMVRLAMEQTKSYIKAGNEAQRDYEKVKKQLKKLKRKMESKWLWWIPEVEMNIK